MKNYFLGNKNRPVVFGNRANYEYEKKFGRSVNQDLYEYQKKIQEAQDCQEPEPSPLVLMVNIAYCGLICGAIKEGKPIDFSLHDVADWIGDDEQTALDILNEFTAAQPQFPEKSEGEPTPQARGKKNTGRN